MSIKIEMHCETPGCNKLTLVQERSDFESLKLSDFVVLRNATMCKECINKRIDELEKIVVGGNHV